VEVSDFYGILLERFFFLSEKWNSRAEDHEEILSRVSSSRRAAALGLEEAREILKSWVNRRRVRGKVTQLIRSLIAIRKDRETFRTSLIPRLYAKFCENISFPAKSVSLQRSS